jgi:hypothetical protein
MMGNQYYHFPGHAQIIQEEGKMPDASAGDVFAPNMGVWRERWSGRYGRSSNRIKGVSRGQFPTTLN